MGSLTTKTDTSEVPEPVCGVWGKFVSRDRCLPLTAHCLDVALVFRSLCDIPGIRRSLDHAAGETLCQHQLDRLAVLAMFHDVGKANWGFQRKVLQPGAPQAGHIRELAPLLDPEILDEALHAAFVAALPPEMPTWFVDEEVAYSYLLATFSHHGRPLMFRGERSGTYWQARREWWVPQGGRDPMAAIHDITRWSREAFPEAFLPSGPVLPAAPRFHHRYAGLLMLADWLGSHAHWFPVEPVNIAERLCKSREAVPHVLRAVGIDVAPLRADLARSCLIQGGFPERFGFPPRPLQAAVDALDPLDPHARLVIAESETGSGKTEAALNWFFKLFAGGHVDGLYFALPTRVAARELYRRVHRTIARWFPDPANRPVTVLAVPGYARVDGLPPERLLPTEEEGVRWQDEENLRQQERQWAAERPKRFLAATVAVGTVDQALLSVVQTAHAHLRSICLDRSLLVVDEVHASDVYMARLLEVLLYHHVGVGGYAVLLSATLGAHARQRFVAAVGGERSLPPAAAAEQAPYPALTLADGVVRPAVPTPSTSKRVHFQLLPTALNLDSIVDRLVEALREGARVLVVMNTVRRANALLRTLEADPRVSREWLFTCEGMVCPHHGRFAPQDRILLDTRVSDRLGPGSADGPIILVGTQTLEQSLDIDADLLVTDLAPADVLLQRVGRLHRHHRRRPAAFNPPARCLVLVPGGDLESALDERGGVIPVFRQLGYGSVYEDMRTLELTCRMLAEQPDIVIPQDNRRLVEGITHPERLAELQGERWTRHAEAVEGSDLARAIAAGLTAAVFDAYFGTFEFNEAGGRVAVRLGANDLQLPLDQPIQSPFGQTLREVVIPGHMVPSRPADKVVVEDHHQGTIVLRCADRRYRYSRYGLETAS